MDSLIIAAARALALGDPLAALKRVALREDAPALALRGIAMAQLGDFDRAKALLRAAGKAFQPREAVSRARCVVAEAEVALVSRDLSWSPARLATAQAVLERHGDVINAALALHLSARRQLLIAQVEEAEQTLGRVDPARLPPAARAMHQLIAAGIAVRRVKADPARSAFAEATDMARLAGVPALIAEVASAARVMEEPAARLISRGQVRSLTLAGVEAVLASGDMVIDASRNVVRSHGALVSLATRPVLFAVLRQLGQVWPADATRDELVVAAFGGKDADESHRARLRVEIGRLRGELAGLATITATQQGFVLEPVKTGAVVVLAPPVDTPHAHILALLADGEAWASSALAVALSSSVRTVQRALEELSRHGKVEAFGRGRAVRWIAPPVPGFPTALLLRGPLPGV